MKLIVHVLGRAVAVLEQAGDFKSVLTYHVGVAENDFVSMTMPVRTESYVWDDQLPPVLQMNLPEGYLLQVLQEQFGPHIGANPRALLSVVGRNMDSRNAGNRYDLVIAGMIIIGVIGLMLDWAMRTLERLKFVRWRYVR